jgi:hypothetical protein
MVWVIGIFSPFYLVGLSLLFLRNNGAEALPTAQAGAHPRQLYLQGAKVQLPAFLGQDRSQGPVLSSGQDALPERPVAAHPLLKFKHSLNHPVRPPIFYSVLCAFASLREAEHEISREAAEAFC